MKPKISILISSYNHEEYIEECIQSAINQTYDNTEILVGDDFSSDKTVEKILLYEDKVDQIHLYDINCGGRTKDLIQFATGEYIAILNSDDCWEHTKLEKQMELLMRNPEFVACFTWCERIDENGKNIENIGNPFCVPNRSSEGWMEWFYFTGNCFAYSSILIRKDVYQQLLDEFGNGKYRQIPDFHMWMNLVQKYPVQMLEEKSTKIRTSFNRGRENVSAGTTENILRQFNEEGHAWYHVINGMEDQFFLNAFKQYLINPNPIDKTDVLCEKFMILLQAKIEYCRIAAIFYYYENYNAIYERLRDVYKFTRNDFYDLVVNIGPTKVLCTLTSDKT